MKKSLNKYGIIIPLICFFIISIISIYSTSDNIKNGSILIKQIMWYIIGFIIIIIMKKLKFKKILDASFIFYAIGNVFLFLLLIFGKEINGSKCWFMIPGIGSIQPSEFMKIILILTNAKIFEICDKKYEKRTFLIDLKIFITIMIITIIPSILTFLEPDTGIVIIYFIISFVMLFIYGIRKIFFIVISIIMIAMITILFYFYSKNQNEFINIFGTSFFYRIDRILDWSNKSGMQLINAMSAIKAAGLTGFGIGNTPIYIPEPHTDFIFSIYSSNTGFIGSIFLIINIIIFDTTLLITSINENNRTYKFIISGFTIILIYQQIQNIGMNIGLLPITGITLPFISYGGSSLLSYMIGIGIILSMETKNTKNKS